MKRLAALLVLLMAGCAVTKPAAQAPLPEPLAPPLCFAANSDLRGLEGFWLKTTEPGHLTLLVHVDDVDNERFAVTDRGGYWPLWCLCQWLANKTGRTVDYVPFGLPMTASYRTDF